MKKILLLLVVAAFSFAALAQDPVAIVSRYEKVTGIDKIDTSNPDMSVMMEAVISAGGQTIPMKCIFQGKTKMRLEMEAMGQKMLMVRDGDKGSMTVPGQGTQQMPKETLEQQSEQMDIVNSLKWSPEKYTFEYKGADKVDGKDVEKVLITPKVVDKKNAPMTAYFDKASGLLVKSESTMDDAPFVTVMKDYKKFDGLMLPQVISVSSKGAEVNKISINDFALDFPVEAWMFAEPK